MNEKYLKTFRYICNRLGRTGESKKTNFVCECGGTIFAHDSCESLCDQIIKKCGPLPAHVPPPQSTVPVALTLIPDSVVPGVPSALHI